MPRRSDPKDSTTRSGGTGHAERVFRVQQAFADLGGDVHGPGEFAEKSGLDDSAVFRILQSGVYQGVFERVGRGRYRLGMTTREVLSVTRSLRTGASGRSILAYLPEPIQRRVLAEPVPDGAGPGVYRDNDELLRSLADIRDQGYAVGLQECMPRWNSCAAPVMWNDSIVGSVLRLKPSTVMPELPSSVIEATKTTAARLSRLSSGSWPAVS